MTLVRSNKFTAALSWCTGARALPGSHQRQHNRRWHLILIRTSCVLPLNLFVSTRDGLTSAPISR
eukprot:COSAG02_NODE_275_length_26232_cov_85.210424_14_plen_65_part_00